MLEVTKVAIRHSIIDARDAAPAQGHTEQIRYGAAAGFPAGHLEDRPREDSDQVGGRDGGILLPEPGGSTKF